jgi:Secretion system C-terminal sorting domain/FRG1-like domain
LKYAFKKNKNQKTKKPKIMKKKNYSLMLVLLITFAFLNNTIREKTSNYFAEVFRPELKDQDGEKEDPNKNRSWTAEEAATYATNFEMVQKSIRASKSLTAKSTAGFADVTTLGTWKSRGPFNVPGSFNFCEVDETTDEVYAVTNGHYGTVQFIWKGNLSGDSNWKLLNPKNPSRFKDLIIIPNGANKRIIAVHEKGRIMYSDNAGQTWTFATGTPASLLSTIVNRQDSNVLYTTDGKIVYKSTNNGTSFTAFYTIGTANVNDARLYTPRWSVQPDAIDVYLAVDRNMFKMNATKTAFTLINSNLPNATGEFSGKIAMGGDTRNLWLVTKDRWYYSTNKGVSFTFQTTHEYDYEVNFHEGIWPGEVGQLGVNPTNPNILIGSYLMPMCTQNGWVTENHDAKQYWGWYQNGNIGNDTHLRDNFHPDIQGSQFFYDKSGKLYTLRSCDGGIFKSYTEWTKTSYPTNDNFKVNFTNIAILGIPSQETYESAFIVGKNNINDFTVGTQDQGIQNSRLSTYNAPVLSWDHTGGGDGPYMATGDGLVGWCIEGYGQSFSRTNLYQGTTYVGILNRPAQTNVFSDSQGFGGVMVDWNDSNRIWTKGNVLRRVEYNSSTGAMATKQDGLANAGDNRIQGLTQSRVNSSVLYALHNGYFYKTTNKGTNWSQIANQTATGMTGSYQNVGEGWTSPLDINIILFASQSGTAVKTILSKNGGTSWANVTGSGANLFPNARVNGMSGTADGRLVFAATSMGPYVFIVSEEKWYPLALQSDVPIFTGQSVVCQKYNGKEYAQFSTFGQGVWNFEIKPTTITNTAKIISLRGNNSKYVSSEDGLVPMNCNRATVGAWEKFEIVDAGAGKIALKSSTGKYISSENGVGSITCNRTSIGSWEKFDIVDLGGGTIAIKGNNGMYVSSQNGTATMTCNSTSINTYERFFRQDQTAKIASTKNLVTEETLKNVKVYPNYATDKITIDLGENELDSIEIAIYNQLGQSVYNRIKHNQPEVIVETSQIPNGLYFCRLTSDGAEVVKKIIVKH